MSSLPSHRQSGYSAGEESAGNAGDPVQFLGWEVLFKKGSVQFIQSLSHVQFFATP